MFESMKKIPLASKYKSKKYIHYTTAINERLSYEHTSRYNNPGTTMWIEVK